MPQMTSRMVTDSYGGLHATSGFAGVARYLAFPEAAASERSRGGPSRMGAALANYRLGRVDPLDQRPFRCLAALIAPVTSNCTGPLIVRRQVPGFLALA